MNPTRFRVEPMRELGRFVLCLGFLALTASAQTQTQTTTHHAPRAAAPATTAQNAAAPPRMKGVWQPMNYPDDIDLESVYFANDNVGWIAGKGSGGFIMHTTDGGAHWNFQMGDPHSNDPELADLHFLDATHGWAYQAGGQLVRTTDGNTWEAVGPFPGFPQDFEFTSPQDGFVLSGDFRGSSIYSTHDGGRTWKNIFSCSTTIQVNGLTRNTTCYLEDLDFVSTRVAYAVGGDYGNSWAAITKTTDGGKTWNVIFASTQVATATSVFFTDENNGVVRLQDNRVLITADGGQSWRGATGSVRGGFKFADPEVGWACVLQYGPSCSITMDGGKSWTTHDFDLPSDFMGYSVPRRDRVYAVGDHGMIYRYDVVPVTYTVQGNVDYSPVPSYGGPIVGQLQQMQTQITTLQTQLGGPSAAGSSAAGGSAGGGFSQSAAPAPSDGNAPIANQAAPPSGGLSQSAPATSAGGFSQDNSGQASAAAAPASTDASASGGFSQDSSGTAPAGQDASASGGFSQDAS
ncbi:MAG: YCF48-related protein, partial [Candidatus Acidiferrales bacterium]